MAARLIKRYKNMINNYLEHEYQPSHKVYTHSASGHSIFLGDIQAALDLSFIKGQRILTGTSDVTQW